MTTEEGAQSSRRTYLHIGGFKTGTSFLQSVLLRNREALARDGVHYPTSARAGWSLQTGGVKDLLRRAEPGTPDGAWGRLVDVVARADSSVTVLSVERLSTYDARHARALVDSLPPSEVHVIYTVRDLARVLPSDWQSKVKQGRTWTFDEYAAAAAGDGPRSANRTFWDHHDAVAISRRWLEVVDPARFHLVTVPPSGAPPDLLWQRFCSVIGIEPDRYDTAQDVKSNFSLSYSDTEFVRQINVAVGRDLSSEARRRWMTRYLANKSLRPTTSSANPSDRPQLTPALQTWAAQRSEQLVAEIRALGVDVVGDLDELVCTPSGAAAAPPVVVYPQRGAELVAALLRKLVEAQPTTVLDGDDDDDGQEPGLAGTSEPHAPSDLVGLGASVAAAGAGRVADGARRATRLARRAARRRLRAGAPPDPAPPGDA